jgi:ribonucleotide monophosphatase NagD (HAD superfamily)
MGFPPDGFAHVMTSGEALWQDIARGAIAARRFLAIERVKGDAEDWAVGLPIELVSEAQEAEAILLMGLPDGASLEEWEATLASWLSLSLPLYCSNPDRQSPRADGLVISPGALAFRYSEIGGACTFYGKPHLPVFTALNDIFGPGRYLMVGDSLEHDIAGAHGAGWDSLLVQGGLYAARFADAETDVVLAELLAEKGCAPPTYCIKGLR